MYLASSKHSAASKTFTPTRSRVTAYAFRCGLRCWFALLAVAAVALAGAQAQAQINVIPVITTLANQYTNKGTTRNNEYALYDEFNSLDGIAIDGSGNIYVSDSLNNIIAEISGGYVYIIAGGGTPTTASTCSGSVDGYGDGCVATNATFSYAEGIALDNAGNLYIADQHNGLIRKLNLTTHIITAVAGGGTYTSAQTCAGHTNSIGDGCAATNAFLFYPYSVAVDASGNLYISDVDNVAVRKVNAATGIITTVAGGGSGSCTGHTDSNGDGCIATSAVLVLPSGIAFDGQGNLYIDDDTTIRKVTASTGIITLIAGGGTSPSTCSGSTDSVGDGCAATNATLNTSSSNIYVDRDGNIFFPDSQNQRVRKINPVTGIITTVAGNGLYNGNENLGGAATSAQLGYPHGVTVDSAGNLYIADTGYYDILEVSSQSFQATNLGSHSSATVYLQTTSAMNITAISVPASQGNVQEYTVGTISGCTVDPSGATQTPSGTLCSVPVTFSPAYPGQRWEPLQVSTLSGATTTVYSVGLSGSGVGPLLGFTPSTISTLAGNGTRCSTTTASPACGDTAAATSAGLNNPSTVALDGAGNVYIADNSDQRIRKVSVSTGIITTVAGNGHTCISPTASPACGDTGLATSAQLADASGVAVDAAGNIYIADTFGYRVRKVSAATGIITTVAGNGHSCSTPTASPACGDYGAATSAQITPSGIAVDAAGNLYIYDTGSNRIRRVAASNGIITTVAGNGHQGYSGDGGPATSAALNFQYAHVAVDNAGNLYIADDGNNVIRAVTAATGIITTVAGGGTSPGSCTGHTDSVGDGCLATNAGLNTPIGIAIDSAGNLYIGDSLDNSIRKVTAATGIITTVAGNGNAAYTGDGGAATSAALNQPAGIAVDSLANLYIVDNLNNRVREVTSTATPLTFATTTEGVKSSDSPQTVTLTNNGNGALTLTTPTGSSTNPILPADGSFTLSNSSTCPQLTASSSTQTLAVGASCSLLINFIPTAITNTGNITYADNSLNSPSASQSISVSGTGVVPPIPTVTGISPSSGPLAGGTSVTITGTNFTGATAVMLGSTSATSFTVVSATSITATAPAGSVGPVDVTVATAGGTSATSAADVFTYTAPASYAAPTTPVATTTATQTAYVVFTTAGTPGQINVLTQGASGLDFALVTGGTCSTNTAYTVGQTCTVQWSFTPVRPGLRTGAITLTSGSTTLASSYIYGTATGPLVTFPSNGTSTSTLGSGFSSPYGTAVDGSGDVFVADYGHGLVKEIVAVGGVVSSSSTVNTVGSGFTHPYAVAVDGAGNVFVADTSASTLKEIVAVNGAVSSSSTVNTVGSGFVSPNGVAVDGSGNLFVADGLNNAVKEIVAAGGYSTINTVGGGFKQPIGMAVDGSGDVFVGDTGNGLVKEIVAVSGVVSSSSTVNVIGSGINAPFGVSVDSSGDVYVADVASNAVKEIVAVNGAVSSSSTVITIASGFSRPTSVALDGSGNIFIADEGNSAVKEIDLHDPPSLTFASTHLNTTSSDSPQTVTVQNIGNTSLSFSVPATGNNPSISTGFSLNSSGGTACPLLTSTSGSAGTLAQSATCTLPISFTPPSAGTNSGSLVITDTNLNVSNATQTISLSGNGIPPVDHFGFTGLPASPTAGVAFTATVRAYSSTDNSTVATSYTGPVTFSTTSTLHTLPGTTTLTAGVSASLSFTLSTAGSQTITVKDQSGSPSTVSPPMNVLPAAATYVQVVSGNNQSAVIGAAFANPLKFEVTDANNNAIPNQVVTFTLPTSGASATLSGCQVASPCSVTTASDGTASVTATANGTASTTAYTVAPTFPGIQSPGAVHAATARPETAVPVGHFTLTNIAASPTLTVTASPTTLVYGQPVTITATSVPASIAGSSPTGAVTFYDNTTTLTSSATPTAGVSTYSTIALVGAQTYAASTAADTNFNAVAETYATAITVAKASSTLTGPATQPVLVVVNTAGSIPVSVTGQYSGSGVSAPSGSVGYTITPSAGGSPVASGSLTIASSAVTVPVAATLSPGAYNVVLTYAGDSNYAAATSITVTMQVGQIQPVISWTQPSPILASTTLAGVLNASALYGTTAVAGTYVYTATPTGGSASTVIATSTLTGGSYTLGVTFTPTNTATYKSATGSVTLTVDDFNLAISAAGGSSSVTSVTVLPGGTAVYTFTLSPVGATTFPVAVTLSASGLPTGATYVFSPATLAAGSGTTNVTLTIQLPQTSASVQHNHGMNKLAPFALALLLLPFARRMRRAGKRLGSALLVLLLLISSAAVMIGLTGCGASTGFFGQAPKTYIVTVTGTSGNLSHSTTVTLTVE